MQFRGKNLAPHMEKKKIRRETASTKERVESKNRAHISLMEDLQTLIRQKQKQCLDIEEDMQGSRKRLEERRVLDSETAGEARREAAQAALHLEIEVRKHNETRYRIKEREEALEASAAEAAGSLAKLERRAEEERKRQSDAVDSLRSVERELQSIGLRRSAAWATVSNLEETLLRYEDCDDRESKTRLIEKQKEKIFSAKSAIEKRDLEISRLEGEAASLREVFRRASSSTNNKKREEGRLSSLENVQQQLKQMQKANEDKECQIEAVRGERKGLLHQLEAERKKSREAHAMVAGIGQGSGGIEDFMERGDSCRRDSFARFRPSRAWPELCRRVAVELDRVSVRLLILLRKDMMVRALIVSYLLFMHILMYALVHHIASRPDTAASPPVPKGAYIPTRLAGASMPTRPGMG
uniref:Uncharacterized protein n=1 Tax=Compsopogon caeruleus TaxID=31354 RepID=A0A7S1TK91_9RHOD|mmetsp:Transcript_8601/g.17426  ORF Transcript_8601/g.17426 Transcript_8601/m.17426 type:complete len:412 (+) Transcript_8601:1657-2892(+)